MIAAGILILLAGQLRDGGPDAGATAVVEADAGAQQTVEIGGLQIPIAADDSMPGHRPVQGLVDEVVPSHTRSSRASRFNYDDLLEARTADLSACASWSPDGRAVKGWLSVEWVVASDGTPSRFKILENDLDSPLVERCMLREMAAWHFPPPPNGDLLVRHNFYLMLPARPELTPIEPP